jgi:hypothetical protein
MSKLTKFIQSHPVNNWLTHKTFIFEEKNQEKEARKKLNFRFQSRSNKFVNLYEPVRDSNQILSCGETVEGNVLFFVLEYIIIQRVV